MSRPGIAGCSPTPTVAFRTFAKCDFEILRTLDDQLGYMAIGNIADVMNLGVILNCRIFGIYYASKRDTYVEVRH